MTDYKFTHDWFHWAPDVWTQLIPMLPERTDDGRYFIEVGSFEGRSAVWIAENMMQPGDYMTCIDTWAGGEEHASEDMGTVEDRFDHNLNALAAIYPDHSIWKMKSSSTRALATDLANRGFADADFIYIDGSHVAKDVLTDACMAWPLLKPKGIMVFDDYLWGNPRDILHRPKTAIDAFCNIFAEEARIVHVGYQLAVQKGD